MEYFDFDIDVGPGNAGRYLVTVRSPAGEAQSVMRFPFAGLVLESRLKDVRIALLRSSGIHRAGPPPEARAVQDFGQQLFDALIAGEVRNRYDVSRQYAEQQRIAGKPETGLRLRLHIQAPELAVIPWEYLYDERQRAYVCLSRQTPLVRYLDLPQALPPLKVTPPLSILGMVASPNGMDPLNIQHEKDRMREALKDLEVAGLVKLRWLEGQTWQDLQKAMWSRSWHIFHFIGHGGFNPNTSEGVLALAGEQGNPHLLNATQLSTLLVDQKDLRLVVLNACEGAKGSDLDLFSSTAATLAQRGIPAVLAMQYEISDHAAIECGRTFYSALASGIPVDGAVAEARKAINLHVTNSLEWGTPVLYLRARNSALFDLPQRTSTEIQLPPQRENQPGPPASSPGTSQGGAAPIKSPPHPGPMQPPPQQVNRPLGNYPAPQQPPSMPPAHNAALPQAVPPVYPPAGSGPWGASMYAQPSMPPGTTPVYQTPPSAPTPSRPKPRYGLAVLITLLLIVLVAGTSLSVLGFNGLGPLGPILATKPSTPATATLSPTATATLSPTATATPTPNPAFISYSTATPGANCDTKGGMWSAVNSMTQCTPNGTIVTKTIDSDWGRQVFQIPGQPIPTYFSAAVTLSSLTDPKFPSSSTDSGACAGFVLNLSSDGTSGELVQVCSNGEVVIISQVKGAWLYKSPPHLGSPSSSYIVSVQVTPTTISVTVNGGQPLSAPIYAASTNLIGLVVFWRYAGAQATFTNFQYIPNN